ncbi:cupin domain-containing protein [Alteromonas facilis]|uniref:cupin domain-containing protein n=1 Tax=Alteromonas facilis TaxID=2048004 RepID=UPI00196AF381|nr:cupin domain-containing protein [Alteromonas facilis]
MNAMRRFGLPTLCVLFLASFSIHGVAQGSAAGPVLESLLKQKLKGVANTEVVVSKVQIPANTSLSKHWHPGEEFAYVLEGSVTLWQQGLEDRLLQAGELASIPLKQIHTAVTGDEGVTLLVFRVHEEGKPERVIVE